MPLVINLGKLEDQVDFPKKVFRRGEDILVNINIDEMLGRKKRKIGFHLMQYTNFKYEVSLLCCYTLEESFKIEVMNYAVKTQDLQFMQSFLVPTDIPSTFEYKDDRITVSYVVKIYVDRKKFKFPIVIGDFYRQDNM